MDFITHLPATEDEFDSIWVITDRLTKRIHLVPVKSTFTSENLADAFKREYIRLHGLPKTVISDRDRLIDCGFWQAWSDLAKVESKMGTAYRSSFDGQTEIVNRLVEDYIRNYIDPHHKMWKQHLDLAEFAFNSRYHTSIKMSPFMADLEPRSVADLKFEQLFTSKQFNRAKDFLLEQQVRLQQARDAMAEAQERQKLYYDRNRPIQKFEIGDLVMLETKHLSNKHVGIGSEGNKKFKPKRIGPFKVLGITNKDTYHIDLGSTIQIHPYFHTSRLFPYVAPENENRLNAPNQVVLSDGEIGYIVEKIVGLRGRGHEEQAKVRWQGYSANYDTWEPVSELSSVRDMVDDYRKARRRKSRHS